MVLVSGDALRCQRTRFMAPLSIRSRSWQVGHKMPKPLVTIRNQCHATGQQQSFIFLAFLNQWNTQRRRVGHSTTFVFGTN